jgi:hypothetical protein
MTKSELTKMLLETLAPSTAKLSPLRPPQGNRQSQYVFIGVPESGLPGELPWYGLSDASGKTLPVLFADEDGAEVQQIWGHVASILTKDFESMGRSGVKMELTLTMGGKSVTLSFNLCNSMSNGILQSLSMIARSGHRGPIGISVERSEQNAKVTFTSFVTFDEDGNQSRVYNQEYSGPLVRPEYNPTKKMINEEVVLTSQMRVIGPLAEALGATYRHKAGNDDGYTPELAPVAAQKPVTKTAVKPGAKPAPVQELDEYIEEYVPETDKDGNVIPF